MIRMGVSGCFFWYRPTRVVPDQRPLNGCVCVVGVSDLRCGAHCQATESTKDRVTKRMKFYGAAYNYDTLQPSSDDTVDESTATVSLCSLCSLAVSTACCSLVPCALSEA